MDEDGWLAGSLTGMVAAVCRSDATAHCWKCDVWMGIRNVALRN